MSSGPDRRLRGPWQYEWEGVTPDGKPLLPRFAARQIVDPFRSVLELGRREARRGMVLGLAGALFLHGGATVRAFLSLVDAARFAADVQRQVAERLRTTYDIQVEQPPPPPPAPEPKPEPQPDPEPKTPPKAVAPAPREAAPPPPPAAAQAGKVLTAEPDPNEPVDLTDQGFVSGEGDRYVGGTTAAKGTSKTAVHNPAASPNGVPGGTGTAPGARDQSKAALPKSTNWDCGFPAEADMEQINTAAVRIVVTVNADGRAKSVQVVKDPGYGFGALARQCAFRMRYNPGADAAGNPITTTTPPFVVRFNR